MYPNVHCSNDIVSNTTSLIAGIIADRWLKYVDPITAIAVGLFIAYGWGKQLWSTLTYSSTLPPFFLILSNFLVCSSSELIERYSISYIEYQVTSSKPLKNEHVDLHCISLE